MLTSEKTDLISAAFVEAHAKFPVIAKDKWNDHYKSWFADLASVRQTVRPILEVHGLALMQPWDAKGAVVTVLTRLLHKSGQYFEEPSTAEAKNSSAQAVGAAVTFISRYAAIGMLDLSVSGDDDDGNSTKKDDAETPSRDPIATPDEIFNRDNEVDLKDLLAELEHRNVPKAKWDGIAKWLHGKSTKLLSRAIVSA